MGEGTPDFCNAAERRLIGVSFSSDKAIRMTIKSSPCCLPVVRAAVEKVCDLIGFDPRETGGIVLSVDEAMANIIRHAYGGDHEKPIEIEIGALGEPGGEPTGLRVCMRDYGTHVDPSMIKSRDLADVRPGGLGVHIMRQCMDTVEYQPGEGCGTVLIMTKNLSPKGAEVE